MFELTIRLSGFDGPSTIVQDRERLRLHLEGLARDNVSLLEQYRTPDGGRIPLIYRSGVRYFDPWDDPKFPAEDCVLAWLSKKAKCDTLAAWRLGELWRLGYSRARIALQNTELPRNVSRWHAGVNLGDGTIEDPSTMVPPLR